MKKVIFLFIALLMGNVIKADPVSKDLVEHVKAIVAYEMNVVSLNSVNQGGKQSTPDLDKFKECASESRTVDEVKKCIPDKYGNCKKLCDAIKALNGESTDPDAVLSYYSDSIFQQKGGAIKTFIDNRPTEIKSLKATIKKRIQDVINQTDESPSDPLEASQIDSQSKTDNTENVNSKQIKEGSSVEGTGDYIEIIKRYSVYLLTLVLVVLTIILFKKNKDLWSEYNYLMDNKEKDEKLLRKKTAETQKLQDTIDRLRQENTELKEQIQALQGDIKNLEEANRKQVGQNLEASSNAAREEKTAEIEPREYYLGVPQDGKFAEGSDIYRPGKVLYKVVSRDDIYGEFEYINRPETIGYAKQSRTRFLESACNIIGENRSDFAQIETRMKGKVERVSDGWKIIKKADIYLM